MTVEAFDAHLLIPSTLHDAGDAYGIVAVTLVDLHFQHRLGVPGVDADDGQPQLIQLGPQPCRRCPCFESNPRDMRRV